MTEVTPQRAHRTVRGLRYGLAAGLTLTVLLCAAGTVLLLAGHATVQRISQRSAPSYEGALSAHTALADADRSVWLSFQQGQMTLTGPGDRFRNDITAAGQELERLAQLNVGGAQTRQLLNELSGELVTYQGLVEQADAGVRQGSTALGRAYLSYATDVLQGQNGLLSDIDQLAAADRAALSHDQHSGWLSPWATAVVVVPAALLVLLLVLAQIRLARTFRRLVNPALVAATLVAAGLAAWYALAVAGCDAHLHDAATRGVPALAGTWTGQTRTADTASAKLRAGATSAPDGGFDVAAAIEPQRALDAVLAEAADTGGLPVGLPLTAVLLALLCMLGLGLRLREFRG